MNETILHKIFRYLIIWLLILVFLLVMTIVVYRHELMQILSAGLTGLLGVVIMCFIVIGAILYVLRLMLP